MISKFKQTGLAIVDSGSVISKIYFNNEFAQALYNFDASPFGLVTSTFGGIPCAIREHQAAAFLIIIQGGKK